MKPDLSIKNSTPWNKVVVSLVLIALAAGAFSVSGLLAKKQRVQGGEALAMADYPPGVRFITVALGGFRGILADGLWLRAAQKQDEGNYFEVAQLSEWITRLEPRYSEVWSYHAWNIAYNISAMFPDPADRWQWIQRGVRLLRDEGIPANPRSGKLYWELGWLYSEKVSGRWDEVPFYTQIRLASDMTALMGGAGGSLGMVKDDPATRTALAAEGLSLDFMRETEGEVGSLDWRLPETHALYWASRGREYQDPNMPWCDRLVWTSMKDMISSGTLHFDPARRLYVRGPRLELARRGVQSRQWEGLMKVPLTGVVVELFLREAMVMLYAFGDEVGAEKARAALVALPGSGGVGTSLEAAVCAEVDERSNAVSTMNRRELIIGFLSKGETWRMLGNEPFAAGFIRLGELYRDAMSRSPEGRGTDDVAAQWESMRQEAKASAATILGGDNN
jgi:hypothetical protein